VEVALQPVIRARAVPPHSICFAACSLFLRLLYLVSINCLETKTE
jgi:hypothetical protein